MALDLLEIIVLAIIFIVFLSFFFRLFRMRGSPARNEPNAVGSTASSIE